MLDHCGEEVPVILMVSVATCGEMVVSACGVDVASADTPACSICVGLSGVVDDAPAVDCSELVAVSAVVELVVVPESLVTVGVDITVSI